MSTVLSIINSGKIIEEAFRKEGFDISDPRVKNVINNLKESNENNIGKEEILIDKEVLKVLDKLSVGVLVDGKSEILYTNGYLSALLGYTEQEFIELDQFSIIHTDDRIAAKRIYELVYSGKENDQTLAHRKAHKDGSFLWVRSQLTGLKNRKGEVAQLLVTHVDFTSLMLSHQRNDEQKLIYKSLVEHTNEGLEVISLNSLNPKDEKNALVMRNHHMTELFLDNDCLYLSPTDFKDIMPACQADGRPSEDVIRLNTEVLKEKKIIEGELDFLISGNSRKCYYSIRLINVGSKVYMIRNYRDITEIKEKETALIESEKKFRGFVEALPGAISIINAQGIHEYVSPQSNEIFGYPEDYSFVGTSVMDFFPPNARKDLSGIIKKLEEHTYWTKVITANKKDASNFPLEINGRLIKGDDRNDDLIITYFIDVSEKEQRLREVNLRKSIYETLIESSIDAIDICEVDLYKATGFKNPKLLMRNHHMEQILGPDMTGLHIDEVKELLVLEKGQNLKDYINSFLKALIKEGQQTLELRIRVVNGDIKDYLAVYRLVEVNEKRFLIRIFNDLTEEKEQKRIISQQLIALKDRQGELEKYIESNLQLENFAYIASHDLKAPLRTVLSFSQLIKRSSYDKLPSKDQEFLDIVIQSTNNMMSLIEDLLTFSRVNTKKVQIQPLRMADLIETISMDLHSKIDQSQAELIWNLDNEYVNADQVKMVQLFENLLMNAIKFMPEDRKPKISIVQSEDDLFYHFEVADNGIGISHSHHQKIFTIFSKLHSKDVYDGTGLGLSICSKIVEQHHGKIWVESDVDKGSTFHFTISKHVSVDD